MSNWPCWMRPGPLTCCSRPRLRWRLVKMASCCSEDCVCAWLSTLGSLLKSLYVPMLAYHLLCFTSPVGKARRANPECSVHLTACCLTPAGRYCAVPVCAALIVQIHGCICCGPQGHNTAWRQTLQDKRVACMLCHELTCWRQDVEQMLSSQCTCWPST